MRAKNVQVTSAICNWPELMGQMDAFVLSIIFVEYYNFKSHIRCSLSEMEYNEWCYIFDPLYCSPLVSDVRYSFPKDYNERIGALSKIVIVILIVF